jgi:hypothetical protein
MSPFRPFSAAPPSLAAGTRRNLGQLLTDEPVDFPGKAGRGEVSGNGTSLLGVPLGIGGIGGGMGGMGGMGGYGYGYGGGMGGMDGYGGGEGGKIGGYSAPESDGDIASGDRDLASKLGLSFPIGDLSRGLVGNRVHLRLPHITIRAGESESIFLPTIPKSIEAIRVYATSISHKHPLSAFQITLQDGYQLPGGPGTVWSDSGYAGDVMFPRLVANVPQMVTYALDSSISIESETSNVNNSKSSYRLDENETLIATTVDERRVRYSLTNEGKEPQQVSIEHQPSDADWQPVSVEEKVGTSSQSSFRYKVNCPQKSTVIHDVLETKTTTAKWPKETNWAQLKRLIAAEKMPEEIRVRLERRIESLRELDELSFDETKLVLAKEKAAAEQNRIKNLIEVLTRQDELHARYLKKLFSLENDIERMADELAGVRNKLEDAKSRKAAGELKPKGP